MPNFWDVMTLNENEEIYHIQIPESAASNNSNKMGIDRQYVFRCKCLGSIRAIEIAREYVYLRLFDEENIEPEDEEGNSNIKLLSKLPTNFRAKCDDNNFGWLWNVSFDLGSFAQVGMNDSEGEFYYNFSASGNSRESTVDANGVPIVLQYQYPIDHPTRAGEIISATGTCTKDVALFTFTKNLIKSMTFPEAAAGFVGYTNSAQWEGYPANSLKITSCSIRGRYTNPDRTSNSEHIYTISYEIQANSELWLETATITDPETGQIPGDLVMDVPQGDCEYPSGRTVEILKSFDFNRLWPSDSTLSFEERGAYEFPLEGS